MATVEAFDEFAVEVSSSGGPALVRVTGDVDCYTAPTLQHRLFELIDGGSRHIVVDLARVSFMDSQGLGALVRTAVRLRPLEGQLALRSPRPNVCKILEITGLGGVLPVD